MKKILLVDDDAENLSLIAQMVEAHYQPLKATSGREGLQLAIRENPDVIVLDVHMPEMDGYEVCKRLREQPATRHIPVIMLTTYNALDNRVRGLDVGADDYIGKPFHARELIARINARLRRTEAERKADEELKVANLRMQSKSMQVWVEDREVHLTRIEFELLRYFLEHPNEVVDRKKLLGDLWPDAVVTNRTVDTHIANLRKKIKGFSAELDTVYGAGYILKTAA